MYPIQIVQYVFRHSKSLLPHFQPKTKLLALAEQSSLSAIMNDDSRLNGWKIGIFIHFRIIDDTLVSISNRSKPSCHYKDSFKNTRKILCRKHENQFTLAERSLPRLYSKWFAKKGHEIISVNASDGSQIQYFPFVRGELQKLITVGAQSVNFHWVSAVNVLAHDNCGSPWHVRAVNDNFSEHTYCGRVFN